MVSGERGDFDWGMELRPFPFFIFNVRLLFVRVYSYIFVLNEIFFPSSDPIVVLLLFFGFIFPNPFVGYEGWMWVGMTKGNLIEVVQRRLGTWDEAAAPLGAGCHLILLDFYPFFSNWWFMGSVSRNCSGKGAFPLQSWSLWAGGPGLLGVSLVAGVSGCPYGYTVHSYGPLGSHDGGHDGRGWGKIWFVANGKIRDLLPIQGNCISAEGEIGLGTWNSTG